MSVNDVAISGTVDDGTVRVVNVSSGSSVSFSRSDYIHNLLPSSVRDITAPRLPEYVQCPYCGHEKNQPDWAVCGEEQVWGCGGALPQINDQPSGEFGITSEEASEALFRIFGSTVKPTSTTRPGIPAREFDRACNNTASKQFQIMNDAIDDMKIELGRAFLSKIVGVFSK